MKNLLSNIFSIKINQEKTHKIITVLGIKLKTKIDLGNFAQPLKETQKKLISNGDPRQSNKILFVYHRNLLKNDTGNNAYCYQIVKTLKSLGYEIDLLITTKICGQNDFENFTSLNTENNNLINNLYLVNDYSQEKYTYSRDSWVSDEMIKVYEKLIKDNCYHSIFVNYTNLIDLLRLSKYKSEARSLLIYHDVHAIQKFIAEQYYYKRTDFYKFGITLAQELDLLNYIDDICCISNDEKQFMLKFFRDKNIYFLPFTLPKTECSQKDKDIDCLFIGGASHHNVLSVVWLMQNVYEHIDKKINITICGKVGELVKEQYPSIHKQMLKCNNIKFIDFASDLDDLYSRTKISIIPILSGTGMKIKTAASYAYNVPVVSTSLGMDGFLDKYENGSLVTDDPVCFAHYINQLISDENLYNKIKQQQEAYYDTHFSQNAQKQRFLTILKQNEVTNVR